jgi:asparagine synthase (glutamine-hydrolysing)
MIGEYLSSSITSQEETLYRDLFRLAPAHSLFVEPGRVRKRRYWELDTDEKVVCSTDLEYAERLSDLIRTAVRCRLRGARPIAAYLSGGLDSSSVVGMAESLLRTEEGVGAGVNAYSLVFPGLPCDESTHISSVLDRWKLERHAVPPDFPGPEYYAAQIRQTADVPDYPNGAMANSLKRLIRDRGHRVVLTGMGGDEWFRGRPIHYSDLLRRFKLISLARQIKHDREVAKVLLPRFPLLMLGVWPLLPSVLRQAIKLALGKDDVPRWIDPGFARRINLSDRLRPPVPRKRFASFTQQRLHNNLLNGGWAHLNEIEERSTARFGLEDRHPLHDRRLLEFAFAIPADQHWRRDEPKFAFREAMRSVLPDSIRNRRDKADFSVLYARAFELFGGERAFRTMGIAATGWIVESEVMKVYREMSTAYRAGDERYGTLVWPLWMLLSIELWFRNANSN